MLAGVIVWDRRFRMAQALTIQRKAAWFRPIIWRR